MGEAMGNSELEVANPVELSGDEVAVLSITARGGALAAIAAWERSVDSLVEKGFLTRGDKFNNFITDAGRKALKQHEDATDQIMAEAFVRVHNAVITSREHAEQAVQFLVKAARETSKANGKHVAHSIRQWSQEIERRALEIADG